jgi:hypothetical protein
MTNDEEVLLASLEFKNDGLYADCMSAFGLRLCDRALSADSPDRS